MKRFLCILLICLMITPALAESIDLSAMTDDELKSEFQVIVSELISRGIWISEKIHAGLYVVGESIPAGTYEFTPQKHDTVSIYPTINDMATGYNRILYLIFDENESFILTLSESMVIDLGSTCIIKPFGFSW